ncbi:CMP-N-acetylneuraminate-beta-galactosamide-alpha-2,3-sialyltransferase 4-like [Huso huso]|uniref:CMP-N-acetylneuraminate-beta-galactosamide-alpha-2,3-sialyltransferase 4-like n=1 Tax=Huso huso TaxID=61971 RepID=A0ABR0Y5Z8_HUSHU
MEQMKMTLKIAKIHKTWVFRLLLVAVPFFCYYFTQDMFLQSQISSHDKVLCVSKYTAKKLDALEVNFTINTQLFLKLEDFFWRKFPYGLALPYGVNGSELVLLKVLAFIAKYEMPEQIQRLTCRTCAVIGNGFTMKNSSLGDTINKYDLVIRLNDAPIRGFEQDVGNKTTIRLFYPESASTKSVDENNPDTLMVLVPFKRIDISWLKELLYDEKRVTKGFWKPVPQVWVGNVGQIRILHPHYLFETAVKLLKIPLKLPPKSKQKPVHPTTGILAVFMALNYCDVVHIAGFGYPKTADHKVPIHYYGSNTMKSMKDSFHDLTKEALALKKLEEAGAIQYLHPHS